VLDAARGAGPGCRMAARERSGRCVAPATRGREDAPRGRPTLGDQARSQLTSPAFVLVTAPGPPGCPLRATPWLPAHEGIRLPGAAGDRSRPRASCAQIACAIGFR